MNILAIITARGGSKRIPKKNIKEFCGRPIIAYSIEAAINSNVFSKVMVSTDSEEIKKIAVEYGAEVPFMRSEAMSNDMAMTHEVIMEVINEYEKLGEQYDAVCCIYPTAPFVTSERLLEAAKMLDDSEIDGVLPIVSFSFPPQRCFIISDGKVQYKWPENRLVRSQDLEPWYHDAGQFCFVKTKPFFEEESLVLKRTRPLILDELEVQDIDNYTDWVIAEMKYKVLNEH